jgi:hypothetical protein
MDGDVNVMLSERNLEDADDIFYRFLFKMIACELFNHSAREILTLTNQKFRTLQ